MATVEAKALADAVHEAMLASVESIAGLFETVLRVERERVARDHERLTALRRLTEEAR